MNVSLPVGLKAYVEAQSQSGYSTPSEFVRELIRADQKQRAREKLEILLLEGVASGEPVSADAGFWRELRAEGRAQVAKRTRAKAGRRTPK